LGEEVTQKGSNITAERLRFDFSFSRKPTTDEIKKVEDLVNQQIDKDLPVTFKIETLEEARKEGALANFTERYGEKVKVYSIGDPPFSIEVCGGPHVAHLSEVSGHVKIYKEESVSSGVRRIYALIESNSAHE
jgi:alanyl-tRNA synthetase